MSDLKLVSPNQPTAFEQRLLDAVTQEAPSAEQRARVRLAMGLPAIAPAPVPMAPVGRRAWVLKAGLGLIVASAAMVGLFTVVGRKATPADAPATPIIAPPASPAAPIADPVIADRASGAAPPLLAPSAAAPQAAVVSSALAPSALTPSKRVSKALVGESGADLSEQLRLIDAARSAVAAGNASAASAALSSYRTRFPRGPFGQEAAVLQIQTLDLQGSHAQAAALARSFLARHPNSPHVSVVQRIAGR